MPNFGGTFPCKPPNAMVSEIASAPHLSWTDEKLVPGDMSLPWPRANCAWLMRPSAPREDAPQVTLVEDDDVIQAFAADRADEALDIWIVPW
jgi:hypothetical protein